VYAEIDTGPHHPVLTRIARTLHLE
jgi:hypothetical protein